MKYRKLGRTGIMVSEIGLGCEHLEGKPFKTIKAVIDEALSLDINIFDIFMSEPQVRTNIGKALAGRRHKVIIQGHMGATWKDGQYALSRDPATIDAAFCDLMSRLGTDYIDIGVLHYVDSEKGYKNVFEGGVLDYAQKLKGKGIIKAIGLGSHNPKIAKKAVDTGIIDVLFFSLNAAFDILPSDMSLDDMYKKDAKKALQARFDADRTALYHACEENGTAITVMKTYMGGRLLEADKSPFDKELTTSQCLHFALTRPAVASALIGCATPEEVKIAVSYETASEADRDFSEIFVSRMTANGAKTPNAAGLCLYCGHCLPCPVGIDIAAAIRCIDTQKFENMPANVENCTACGACEERCPFGVSIIKTLQNFT